MSRYRLSTFALYVTYDIARLDIRCCLLSIIALYMICDISRLGIATIIALFVACDIARLEFVSTRVPIGSRHREILDTNARVSIDSHMKFTCEYSTLRNNFRHVLLEIIPVLTNAFTYDSVHWYIDHVIWHSHVLWAILIIEYNNSTIAIFNSDSRTSQSIIIASFASYIFVSLEIFKFQERSFAFEFTQNIVTSHVDIFTIDVASFVRLARKKDHQINVIIFKDIEKVFSLKDEFDSTILLFKKYHEFLNVFFQKIVEELSSHRFYDHKIQF